MQTKTQRTDRKMIKLSKNRGFMEILGENQRTWGNYVEAFLRTKTLPGIFDFRTEIVGCFVKYPIKDF